MNNRIISPISICIGILLFCFNPLAVVASAESIPASCEISITDFDESEIYCSFSQIDELVAYIESNTNITYSDLDKNYINHASISESSSFLQLSEDDDKFQFNNQTAFISGCAFGIMGVVIVAIINNGNTDDVVNSALGCATSSIVSSALLEVFYVLLFMYLFIDSFN